MNISCGLLCQGIDPVTAAEILTKNLVRNTEVLVCYTVYKDGSGDLPHVLLNESSWEYLLETSSNTKGLHRNRFLVLDYT